MLFEIMIDLGALSLFVREKPFNATERFVTQFEVPDTLPYFEGHFPENPILPGVAMIDLTVEALKVHCEESRPLVGLRSAKYLGLVQPKHAVSLEISRNSPDEWQVVWLVENKKVCDLVLNFG